MSTTIGPGDDGQAVDQHDVVRAADGRWVKPPRSPGRPAGPSRAERVAQVIEQHIPAILAKAIELAKLGDPQAQRLVMERFAPVVRPEDEKVQIKGFSDAPTLELKSAAVMQAIASGQVSAAAGQRLLQALEVHCRIVTAGEMEQRLQALERAAGDTPKPLTVDAATGTVLPADNSDIA